MVTSSEVVHLSPAVVLQVANGKTRQQAVLTFSLGFFSVLRRFWDMKYGLSADPSLRSRSSTEGITIKSEPKSAQQ
ncbi:hypothetical protein AOLI_G00004740 [Acnodon oligacanthus]